VSFRVRPAQGAFPARYLARSAPARSEPGHTPRTPRHGRRPGGEKARGC